jgi:hypothetical protein
VMTMAITPSSRPVSILDLPLAHSERRGSAAGPLVEAD